MTIVFERRVDLVIWIVWFHSIDWIYPSRTDQIETDAATKFQQAVHAKVVSGPLDV